MRSQRRSLNIGTTIELRHLHNLRGLLLLFFLSLFLDGLLLRNLLLLLFMESILGLAARIAAGRQLKTFQLIIFITVELLSLAQLDPFAASAIRTLLIFWLCNFLMLVIVVFASGALSPGSFVAVLNAESTPLYLISFLTVYAFCFLSSGKLFCFFRLLEPGSQITSLSFFSSSTSTDFLEDWFA